MVLVGWVKIGVSVMKIDLEEVEYLTETSITIRRARRRITVPKAVVDHFGLEDGDRFIWVLFKDDKLVSSPSRILGLGGLN